MKILQINPLLPISKKAGGAEKFVLDLSSNLQLQKQEVALVSGFHATTIKNIKHYSLPAMQSKLLRKTFFDYVNPFAITRFKKIIINFQPDIVHFHNFYGISSYLAFMSSQSIPTVITAHDYWPFCYWSTMTHNNLPCANCYSNDTKKNTLSRVVHTLHKRINAHYLSRSVFVAPSQFMKHQLEKKGNFSSVRMIHNGIEMPSGSSTYTKNILWVGRIAKEKGLGNMLPFIASIAENHAWKVSIVGEGPLKTQLKDKYTYAKFYGYQSPTSFYKKASIYVMTSVWPENLPYSLLEAMSYGLAVIAPRLGGIQEIIVDGQDGLLYSTPNEFKEKLTKLITNNKMQRILGRNALEKVKTHFSWENTTDEYMRLYSRLLQQKTPCFIHNKE